MRITPLPLIFLLTAMVLFSTCNSAYAYENDIGVSRIGPTSPIYFLKTVRENLEISLALTPRVKLIRQLEFATRRLREVKSLILVNRQDLIEPTMERYWFHISRLPDKDLKDEELILRIKESLVVHLKTLDIIYSKVSDPGVKRAIRSALNKIVDRADIPISARIPICDFFALEATTSLSLTQTEKVILLERAQKCQNLNK